MHVLTNATYFMIHTHNECVRSSLMHVHASDIFKVQHKEALEPNLSKKRLRHFRSRSLPFIWVWLKSAEPTFAHWE